MDLKSLFKGKKTEADLEVDRVLSYLATLTPNSPEYLAAVNNLKTLQESRSYKSESSVGKETWVIVGAGLLQFVLIMLWEESHMLPKNALSWFMKSKL